MEEIITFAYSSKDNVLNEGGNMQQEQEQEAEESNLQLQAEERECDLEVGQNYSPSNPW